MRKLAVVLAVALSALAIPATAGARTIINLTECHMAVSGGALGVLQQDLTCSSDDAFDLDDNASLDLNGHTLTITTGTGISVGAISCATRCAVYGGTITDTRPDPFSGAQIYAGWLKLHDMQLNSATRGIRVLTNTLQLTNVTATASDVLFGAQSKMTVKNTSITTTGVQPYGPNSCLMATSIDASVNATDVHLQGCNIWSFGKVIGKRLTVTGSSDWGIATKGNLVKLTDSTITGNPVDIAGVTKPILKGTVCGTSAVASTFDGSPVPGTTWHVCTNDAP